jgi:hypothetical protein
MEIRRALADAAHNEYTTRSPIYKISAIGIVYPLAKRRSDRVFHAKIKDPGSSDVNPICSTIVLCKVFFSLSQDGHYLDNISKAQLPP